jgi:hypothetical protein
LPRTQFVAAKHSDALPRPLQRRAAVDSPVHHQASNVRRLDIRSRSVFASSQKSLNPRARDPSLRFEKPLEKSTVKDFEAVLPVERLLACAWLTPARGMTRHAVIIPSAVCFIITQLEAKPDRAKCFCGSRAKFKNVPQSCKSAQIFRFSVLNARSYQLNFQERLFVIDNFIYIL